MSGMHRYHPAFLTFSLLIVFGFILNPMPSLSAESPEYRLIAALCLLAPTVPLLIYLRRIALPRTAAPTRAKAGAILCLLFGLVLTFFYLFAGSSASTDISELHGVSLTLAAASSVLWLDFEHLQRRWKILTVAGLCFAGFAAAWSLSLVPAVVIRTNQVADGHPFCLARHGPAEPIESFWELRGFSFYTTWTGYKSTSTWYYHGILIVDRGGI